MSKKEDILNAATKLLAAKGYKDASMAELAKFSGVAQGTIFYHYSNKEELFLSILKAFKEDIGTHFAHYANGRRFNTGLDKVDEVIDFYLHLVSQMEDRFMLLHRHDAYELAQVNPVCRNYLESIYDCLIDIFEKSIEAGQKEGVFRKTPARRLAMVMFSMVDGLVRFNTYKLYDAGVLYEEVVKSCRILVKNKFLTER